MFKLNVENKFSTHRLTVIIRMFLLRYIHTHIHTHIHVSVPMRTIFLRCTCTWHSNSNGFGYPVCVCNSQNVQCLSIVSIIYFIETLIVSLIQRILNANERNYICVMYFYVIIKLAKEGRCILWTLNCESVCLHITRTMCMFK